MKKCVAVFACMAWAGLIVGCSQEAATPPATDQANATTSPAVDGSQYLLSVEPEAANDVVKVRESAKDGDEIVITGRIGGRENPWVEGRAAFSIVDGSLKACSDIPGDNCPTPWDYCCQTPQLPTSTALVKIVDDGGDIVKSDARKLLNVQELSTVVIKGKARRDEAGNLTVLANGVYVKQK